MHVTQKRFFNIKNKQNDLIKKLYPCNIKNIL